MAEDKVPGPDGFLPLIFRRYWPIFWVEMAKTIREFFATGVMPLDWMRTFITLIPKKSNTTELSHYRSISLYTTLLEPILPRIIYYEQETFIGGQSITINVMIV